MISAIRPHPDDGTSGRLVEDVDRKLLGPESRQTEVDEFIEQVYLRGDHCLYRELEVCLAGTCRR